MAIEQVTEKLTVKNFGPIADAEIIIRRLNIFIGTNSSGKSTAAKLISIFKSTSIRSVTTKEEFVALLADYDIRFHIKSETFIRYECMSYFFEINQESVYTNASIQENVPQPGPVYIPSARVAFSTFFQSVFELINSNISLPKYLMDFGAKLEKAKSSLNRFDIGFLKLGFESNDYGEYVITTDGFKIKLSQASGGIQSVMPLILVIKHYAGKGKLSDNFFVIEEPELNLFPSSQKDLIEYIIGKKNQFGTDMIITTHSPYILSTIDNQIQAQNVADMNKSLEDEVDKIVPKSLWLDFDSVSCYHFDAGWCRSTLDTENRSIGPSHIDDLSIKINDTFEKLLLLKYPV